MQQLSFVKVEQRPHVRDLPTRERPGNRLREVGPMAVSTTELLACLLQTSDAFHQAQILLTRFEGLPGLARASEAEIVQVDGIGPAQAARIRAALEFGRRLVVAGVEDRPLIRSPSDVAHLLMAEMGQLEQENFVVISLDTRNRILAQQTLYMGSLNTSYIRVAEVFHEAIKRNAAAIIVAHNHPSGDPTPSP